MIADAVVQRWELGNVYARPGRHRFQAALEPALGAHANLHLAGDYFAELGNLEAAARTGRSPPSASRHSSAKPPPITAPTERTRFAMPDHAGFHGVLPALITPFSDDGAAIDADALAANGRAPRPRPVSAGLVPGGSTGEFTTLTGAERRELIEVTVAAAAGRVPVVAGSGALSTRETVELSVHAERAARPP